MALGATRRQIASLVLLNTAARTLGGAAVGSLIALLVRRSISTGLYGHTSSSVAPIAVGVMLMVVVAVAAAVLPTHRATAADPVRALRND